MRIARFVTSENDAPRVAVAFPDRDFVDLGPLSTASLIEEGIHAIKTRAETATDEIDQDRPGFRWLSPLDFVASLRDFLTFEDHVKKGAQRRGTTVSDYWYEAPIYYKGNHRSIIGPDDECPWPDYTDRLDFELELAMIVGRRGRDISVADAADHIFGFTVLNDFSARDIQAREMTTFLGPAKGKDFANALGPCIVTVDELGAAPDLDMICRVNGEEWGRARSSAAHWRWSDLIHHVSRSEDVYPCDVYGSGTPAGCCGLDLGRQVEPGDVVELEIERIGVLRSTFGARPSR